MLQIPFEYFHDKHRFREGELIANQLAVGTDQPTDRH